MKKLFTAISIGLIALNGLIPFPAQADETVCAMHPAQKSISKKDGKTMAQSKQNPADNLHRSRCMIEIILKDLATSYSGVGGGGISSIKAVTSTSYIVSLPQEERIDLLTYEFNVAANGAVTIKSKLASTQSVGPK